MKAAAWPIERSSKPAPAPQSAANSAAAATMIQSSSLKNLNGKRRVDVDAPARRGRCGRDGPIVGRGVRRNFIGAIGQVSRREREIGVARLVDRQAEEGERGGQFGQARGLRLGRDRNRLSLGRKSEDFRARLVQIGADELQCGLRHS